MTSARRAANTRMNIPHNHVDGQCNLLECKPTVVTPDVERRYSSLLLAAGVLAEENDRLRTRLAKAMALTVAVIKEGKEGSRNKSLALSRRALAAMRGLGEG